MGGKRELLPPPISTPKVEMTVLLKKHKSFSRHFEVKAREKGALYSGTWELTFRCNFRCQHCYIPKKNLEGKEGELDYEEVCFILDKLHDEGCLYLAFTGGEPLLRPDFWEIYLYAKKKGFLVSIFTNGSLIDNKALKFLKKYPPFRVEITLHSIKKNKFEAITQTPGSFRKVKRNIELLHSYGIPLTVKTVGMTLNGNEILSIKKYVDNLKGVRYKLDFLLVPRLNGEREPLHLRLPLQEVVNIEISHQDFRKQAKREFEQGEKINFNGHLFPCLGRNTQFLIDPQGKLQYCIYLRNFNIAILNSSDFPRVFQVKTNLLFHKKFPSNSPCYKCTIRYLCQQCPAIACLEGKDPHFPMDYFCQLARVRFQEKGKYLNLEMKKREEKR